MIYTCLFTSQLSKTHKGPIFSSQRFGSIWDVRWDPVAAWELLFAQPILSKELAPEAVLKDLQPGTGGLPTPGLFHVKNKNPKHHLTEEMESLGIQK